MIDFLKRFGQWGMVAGSAEGIGAAFCEELARRGMNLLMVDMNKAGMEALAWHLQQEFHIQVRTIHLDLAEKSAAAGCLEAMNGLDCRLLLYNAAYSRVKPFLSSGTDELDLYIDVNVRTPAHLVHLFASKLRTANKTGGILLMSSLAGLWGARLVATYSGTKAFNLLLAEALSFELKPHGIDVSAVCAGATATPGYLGTHPSYGLIRPSVMTPGKVASIAIEKLGKRTVIIPGFSNRLTWFLLGRVLPRRIAAKMVNATMAVTYDHLLKS